VPVKVSQIANDLGYVTETVTNEIAAVVTDLEERIGQSQPPNYAAVSNAALSTAAPAAGMCFLMFISGS
jgi:hypothetical protein